MFFSTENRKIRYTDDGKGLAVVLLHGYPLSSDLWKGFGDKLASRFRVIMVDLPGHGLSDVIGEIHSMEMMAKIVKDIIGSLGIEKIFLIGHSLGGYVTLAFLDLYPDSLLGYCLFHSHPLPDTPEIKEKRKDEIEKISSGKKELIYPANIRKMFAYPDLEKFRGALGLAMEIASGTADAGMIGVLKGMMARPSRVGIMEEGKVPCLWILGEKDNYIPFNKIVENVRLPKNAKLSVLANAGHLGFIEEEEKSLMIVTDFINSLV